MLGTRGRALPSGRAVAGGFLVAVAAVLVFAASLSRVGGTEKRWVVVTHRLGPGTVLGSADLATAPMKLPGRISVDAFARTTPLVGRTLAVPVMAGELLESSLLRPVGRQSVLRPVSVAVDPAGLSGLRPGQPVDVLEIIGDGASTSVSLVVRGASLVATSSSGSGVFGSSGSADVTLGVASLAEVEAVVEAAHSGSVTLVAAEPSDGVGPGPGTSSP